MEAKSSNPTEKYQSHPVSSSFKRFYFAVMPKKNEAWHINYTGNYPDENFMEFFPFPFYLEYEFLGTAELIFKMANEDYVFADNCIVLDKIKAPVSYNVHLSADKQTLTLFVNLIEAVDHFKSFNFQIGCIDESQRVNGGTTVYYSQDPKLSIKGNQG